MTIEKTLMTRSGGKCELCSAQESLTVFEVPESPDSGTSGSIMTCGICRGQIEQPETIEANHWRCLNDSMWSQEPAVRVMAWRMLNTLSAEQGWARDMLDMMYLEEDVRSWAEAGVSEDVPPTLDCNGTPLKAGDTVTIIKDLVVKGAGFTAKRGTAVRNISLPENHEHIEGRVNGTRVVLVAAYMKKSS